MQCLHTGCLNLEDRWWLPAYDCLTLPIIRQLNDGSQNAFAGLDSLVNLPFLFPVGRPLQIPAPSFWSAENSLWLDTYRSLLEDSVWLRNFENFNYVSCNVRDSPTDPTFCGTVRSIVGGSAQRVQDQERQCGSSSEHYHSDNTLVTDEYPSSDASSSEEVVHTNREHSSVQAAGKRSGAKHKFRRLDSLPFGCPQCGKRFNKSLKLARHIRGHLGEKPYSCNVCQRKFSRFDHWMTHEGTHRGEKPFKCAHCPYEAIRQDVVTRHMRASGCGRHEVQIVHGDKGSLL